MIATIASSLGMSPDYLREEVEKVVDFHVEKPSVEAELSALADEFKFCLVASPGGMGPLLASLLDVPVAPRNVERLSLVVSLDEVSRPSRRPAARGPPSSVD